MRTVILIGLLTIADAISEGVNYQSDDIVKFVAIILLVAMVMDLVEFLHNITQGD